MTKYSVDVKIFRIRASEAQSHEIRIKIRAHELTGKQVYMGIIDEWYTVFQKIKIPHGLILPVGLMRQTFELSFPAFTLTRC